MKKCLPCRAGSWTVGLTAVGLGVCGAFGLEPLAALPEQATGAIPVAAGVLGVTGVLFLLAQVVPCPLCKRAQKTA